MKPIAPLLRRIALLAGITATAALPLNAHSTEYEVVKSVTRLYSYLLTNYEGHIVFQVDSPPAGCVAFWFDQGTTPAANAAAKNSYALLLSAYHTQALVRIVAVDTQLWSGSSQPHCKVTTVALD
ncbi:hypothetical protein [Peristeroidobacter soli]|jgi:hypothetical protein|uniref:hypothetical protein n=1 Tax=Peristeroidobacter soli TaxID=2497877 RepID=UPI00101DE041|nr:hypothetical protein [Peristeroidobacter soli]